MLGIDIFTANTTLTIGEVFVISCTVTNVSADYIRLLRDNQTAFEIRNNTQLNKTIFVNDSLHASQFLCEAQLTGGNMTAHSDHVAVSVNSNDSVSITVL